MRCSSRTKSSGGGVAAEGKTSRLRILAGRKCPSKIIASITPSITNRTLLMHIINLFPSHSLFWGWRGLGVMLGVDWAIEAVLS
jgi:hypothetical protein